MVGGTDIFGGLWHLKALFESNARSGAASSLPKTIWIFSDMMNETKDFPMPEMIELGPERMLERAKAKGLLVPLNGYKIYVYGASTNGLKPQGWATVREFWTVYFSTAGAELVTYSMQADPQR